MTGVTSDTTTLRDEVVEAFKEYATALMPEDVRPYGEDQIIIHTVDAGLFEITVRKL